jgi:phosphatidylinositol glycan class Z
LAAWVIFNGLFGALMGIYHQGGVVPTQLHIPTLLTNSTGETPSGTANVFWWKTYPPPLWLLGTTNLTDGLSVQTHDLMGIPGAEMLSHITKSLPNCNLYASFSRGTTSEYPPSDDETGDTVLPIPKNPTLLVAPTSNTFLDAYIRRVSESVPDAQQMRLYELWKYQRHLNLDDLDFAEDGALNTLKRVLGRRGLSVFIVSRGCA